FAGKASALLPPEPWNGDTWSQWTATVKDATGRKGRELFRPLRLALTGREHGPEMKDLLPLIGRAKAVARLRGETAQPSAVSLWYEGAMMIALRIASPLPCRRRA